MVQKNTNNRDFDLKDDVAKLKEALTQTAQHLKGRAEEIVSDSFDGVKSKSASIEHHVVSYVKDHPVRAVAFSVLAGMVIAKLLRK